MGACFGSNSSVAKNEIKQKDFTVKPPSKDQFDLSQHDDAISRSIMRRDEAGSSANVAIVAPKARRVVQSALQPQDEDEFDLSQHDGRNLKFQMKNKIVASYPNNYKESTVGMGRSLSVESFGSLARAVDRENAEYDARCSTTGAINSNQDYDNESMKSQEDYDLHLIRPGADNIVSVLYAGKTKKGFAPNNPKKRNQDSFIMQHDVRTSSLVIACFDGHGQFGHDVSRFCKIYMERELVSHHLFLSDLHQAILDVTAQLEKEMMTASHVDTVFSGTTMVLIIMQGTIVTVANVGDSRVILGYKKDVTPYPVSIIKSQISETISPGTSIEDNSSILMAMAQANTSNVASSMLSKSLLSTAVVSGTDDIVLDEMEPDTRVWGATTTVPLSKDHKPDDPKERDFILKAGGRVKEVHGTFRVYLALDEVPGLAMSRSLGDYVAHSAGVSSIPEVFQYDLTALYAETCTTGGACPSSIPLGTIPQTSDTENKSETEIVSTKSLVNAVGEVAVRCVILIATDGLYDMMTNEKAVDIAFNHWSDPAAAAEEMLTQTGKDWMATWGLADDTTVCVVNLEHAGSPLGM